MKHPPYALAETETNTWFYKRGTLLLVSLFVILIGITYLFEQWDGDRRITALFFDPPKTWTLVETQPWKWMYEYGTIPGLLFTVVSVVAVFLSWIKPQWVTWRRYLLVIALTSIIGGGVIVNGLLKDYWGRTRPRQIQEFGGRWDYLPVAQLGIPGKGKSFPCGHCTMAFVSVSMLFLYRKSKFWAWLGTLIGLIYGGLMSIARIGQGGHFPADAFWALGVILGTSILLYYFILKPPLAKASSTSKLTKPQAIGMGFGLVAAISVMVFLFLTRRPVFEDYKHGLSLIRMERIQVNTNFDWDNIEIRSGEGKDGSIQTIVRGFGLPNAYNQVKIKRTRGEDQTFYLDYQVTSHGYFSELNYVVQITIPPHLVDHIEAAQPKD